MSVETLGEILLVASAVLLIAVTAVRLSVGVGLPSLMVYLGLGLLIGEYTTFNDAELTGALGYLALVAILAEGGLTTRWETIRPSVAPSAVLSTLGTLISIGLVGVFAHHLLDRSWTQSLLVGAVVSSTDAAAVFSVLRSVPLPERLVGMLEAESGFNDAPVVIAVVALTSQILGTDEHGWWLIAIEAVTELAIGAAMGIVLGRYGAEAIRRVALPASGLYPIAVLGLIFFTYGLTVVMHGSGFLAVYLAALILGNVRLPHGAAVRGFAEGLGWIAQIALFVLLGVLASPHGLQDQLVPAVLLGLLLLFVARPASVLASVVWFGVPWREQAFLAWAGLRGAVPIVLATVPLSRGLPGSQALFDLVFVLVIVFTLVQGPTLPWVARRLGLSGTVATHDLGVESQPLGALNADVIQVRVGPTSRLHGVEVFELRLPPGANITLVVRAGDPFVPHPHTVLQHGDDLIVVTGAAVRDATQRRLEEVSRDGKLAGWHRRPAPG